MARMILLGIVVVVITVYTIVKVRKTFKDD